MLKNGDFEAEWTEEGGHRCHVFPGSEEPYITDIGNIFTPPGWTFWFKHVPGTWDQPEARDARRSVDPRRIHGGEKAFLWFTFCRQHDAGLYQRVEVPADTQLTLTGWGHAWSNHYGEHGDDPYWSEGPGFGPGFLMRKDQLPEGFAEEWRNFSFWLGIDPTGGVDPEADAVVWGPGAHIYNQHAEIPPVQVRSEAARVTVFVCSRTLWPFKHNDAYIDDLCLTITPPDETRPLRGQPREQYARTYVLLPPEADATWAQAVVDASWDAHRFTFGGSADDAGIGDLDSRRVIAVNPEGWPGNLAAFYREHYPGVAVAKVEAATPEELTEALHAFD